MKKTILISCLMTLCAVADEPEKLTLSSTTITSETFTETVAGNGMFYSDTNGVAFLAAGSVDTPYAITQTDNQGNSATDIALSTGSSAAVNVGSFAGESHLSIGAKESLNVYTENSMFIGGFGWHDSNPNWHKNATLTSNKTDQGLPFAAHEGTVTVYAGSKLEVGTGLGSTHSATGGSQLYVGHSAQGTLTVDGGTVISHAHLVVSGTSDVKDIDNSGQLNIKNEGKVTITAEPQHLTAGDGSPFYNQLLVGNDNANGSTGTVIIDGKNSELKLESSATQINNQSFYTYATIGRNGGIGKLTVQNQGTLTIGTNSAATTFTYIGDGTDAQGTLTVQNYATANIKGNIYAGANGGEGTVTIDSGGVLNHTLGTFIIGTNTGSGSVNVKETGTLNTQDIYIGYNNGQQSSLNVAQYGTTNANNVYMAEANNDAAANSITNNGNMKVSGYFNAAAYNHVTNSGSLKIDGNTWIQANAALTNSGFMSAGKTIYLYTGSNIKNTGSMQGNSIDIGANQAITNDGVMTATTSEAEGIRLGDGAAIRNNGTLSGNVKGNGVVDGIGNMADVTIGESTKLVVGETITGLQVTKSITLGSGSTTIFNIAGSELADVGSNDGWASDTHSVIRVNDDARAAVNKGAAFELIFGGTEIWDDMNMEEDTIIWDFTLTLIEGGVAAGSIDLDALLSNTTFSLTTDASDATGLNSLNVTNAHYEITQNGNLILTGSIAVPEPTTATLSLLALAALAARRRRK